MASTAERDRKRRHLSSVSPTAATAAKKHPLAPCSEDKKLDLTVLKYKNEKLAEQLEVQKYEHQCLENKFGQVKEKQKSFSDTLALANSSLDRVLDDLESISVSKIGSCASRSDSGHNYSSNDGTCSSSMEGDFLSRLIETGATEHSGCESASTNYAQINKLLNIQLSAKSTNILRNVCSSIDDVWRLNNSVTSSLLSLLEGETSEQLRRATNNQLEELNSTLRDLDNVHLKHRELAGIVQDKRDLSARNKAEQRRLREELASTVAELEECNKKLAILKSQRDSTQGTPVLYPIFGNKSMGQDKIRDKQKEMRDLETTYKDLTDLVSNRLAKLTRLHEERIETLKKLATFQNALTDIKGITSSKAYQLVNDQLTKSLAEMDQCHASLEKLQIERDNFFWREKEMALKSDAAEISFRVASYSESRITELEQMLQNLAQERILMEAKLEEALKEPGRKQIISEFKGLVSSLPKEMAIMQTELSKYKNAASDLHLLRAEVQSLSSILNRKDSELGALTSRFAHAHSEIKRLQAAAQGIRETNHELKLFLDMYKRESTDSREVMEGREREFKAWAEVQSLKSNLDEQKLELRVKEAIEAEAVSQQRLAAAEAEIAELRQRLESSRRDLGMLSETLKSKHEEGEAYLSEIESIGQAYEDMQTQNQHLLQQITERDDHNTKLVMEGVRARQVQNGLRLEVETLHKKVQHASSLMELYSTKLVRLEDQLKVWSEQVAKLAQDGWQSSVSLGDAQRKLVDVQGETKQLRQSANEIQTSVESSRTEIAELLAELEKERFRKKRIEDDLEVNTRKLENLRERSEGMSVLDKLRQEVREYRGILKCGVCHDRQKEVVIAKCYHLLCNRCVQRALESRQRRCPTCSSIFGPNDVKPIYI